MVRQNHSRGTLGQLAQSPLLCQPHPTTYFAFKLHSYLSGLVCTRIHLLTGLRTSIASPLQLPMKEMRTGTGCNRKLEKPDECWTLKILDIACGLHAILGHMAGMSQDWSPLPAWLVEGNPGSAHFWRQNTPRSLPVWQSPRPRLHRGKSSTSPRNQNGTSPSPITANIQDLPSTLYSAGPLASLHSCLDISAGHIIPITVREGGGV